MAPMGGKLSLCIKQPRVCTNRNAPGERHTVDGASNRRNRLWHRTETPRNREVGLGWD